MRVALLTLVTPEVAALGRLSGPNRRSYCGRHGYAFVCGTERLDPFRHPAWSKIPLILQHLDRYDWVFWSDCDSLVTNPGVRLEDLLAGAGAVDAGGGVDLVITRDRHGCNSGQFLVSNRSGRARPFLEAAFAQEQFVAHAPLHDQAALTHAIDANLAALSVRYLPKRRLNAGVDDWRDGDFLIHYYVQPARVYLMRRRLGWEPGRGKRGGGVAG